MNDVFLSHKCVDKRSPALPVSAPSAFSFIFYRFLFPLFSAFVPLPPQRWTESLSIHTKRIILAPLPAPLPLFETDDLGLWIFRNKCTYDLIRISHTSDPSPSKNTNKLSCKLFSSLLIPDFCCIHSKVSCWLFTNGKCLSTVYWRQITWRVVENLTCL